MSIFTFPWTRKLVAKFFIYWIVVQFCAGVVCTLTVANTELLLSRERERFSIFFFCWKTRTNPLDEDLFRCWCETSPTNRKPKALEKTEVNDFLVPSFLAKQIMKEIGNSSDILEKTVFHGVTGIQVYLYYLFYWFTRIENADYWQGYTLCKGYS